MSEPVCKRSARFPTDAPPYCACPLDECAKEKGEPRPSYDDSYRLWVNEEHTVLVRIWATGLAEMATRRDPSHTWGPPIRLEEERV